MSIPKFTLVAVPGARRHRRRAPPTAFGLAVQRTGTLAWELDVIKAHGLDQQGSTCRSRRIELASTEAGKIALKGGSADLMLSDWLWVARERSLGDNLVFYPSSSTLGARHGAGAVADQGRSPISRARSSRSPAARSTRAGCCCRRWRAARASICARQATHRLRRAAAAVAEGAAGRERRDADVLEFLRRARGQGLQARHRHGRRHEAARRQGRGRDRRLHLRRRLGGDATASTVDRFLDATRQAKEILAVVRGRMAAARAAHRRDRPDGARDLPPALRRRHRAPPARRGGGRRARALSRARRGRRHRAGRPGARARSRHLLPAGRGE